MDPLPSFTEELDRAEATEDKQTGSGAPHRSRTPPGGTTNEPHGATHRNTAAPRAPAADHQADEKSPTAATDHGVDTGHRVIRHGRDHRRNTPDLGKRVEGRPSNLSTRRMRSNG